MRRIVLLLAVLLPPVLLAQGIITTVAGSDWLFPADGRNALSAPLGVISQIATGPDGSLYIADPDNEMVFRIGKDGILHVVAGTGEAGNSGNNGPATRAMLDRPSSVAVDSAGNVYIADTDNSQIRKVDAKGIISLYAGTGDYDSFGEKIPATLAKFRTPYSISVDPSGNLYIADAASHTVRRIDPATGLITTVAGTGGPGFSGDNGPAASAVLAYPYGVFADVKGQVWIADTGNHRIRRVGTDGIIRTIVGTSQTYPIQDGLKADQSAISAPVSVAVDGTGVIYIADGDNDVRVRKVGLDGILTTLAGTGDRGFSGDGGPAAKAQLNEPAGLAIDGNGNVYVSDNLNRRVRIITPDQVIQTFAGNGAF
jgi:sugar lactone lactonase YvrE